MTYVPALPSDGLMGWTFLKRTEAMQKETFKNSAEIKRSSSNATDVLKKASSTEELVQDHQTLKVVLTAFGLENDLNSKFFVQKVIDSDLNDKKSLANRLSYNRYKTMARDLQSLQTGLFPAHIQNILSRFKDHSFELAIGEQNETMRLALNAEREIVNIANSEGSLNTKWYTLMGNPSLKKVFETIFRLPSSFGKLDLERQLDEFKTRANKLFGSTDLAIFQNGETVEKLTEKFIIQTQVNSVQTNLSSSSIALSLLQDLSF